MKFGQIDCKGKLNFVRSIDRLQMMLKRKMCL